MKYPILDVLLHGYEKASNWKDFYPRRIVCPSGYYDPKYHSTLVAASMIVKTTNSEYVPPEETALIYELSQMKFPTYFITGDFFQAVINTEPPVVNTIDLKLPLKAMRICLPVAVTSKFFCGFPMAFFSFCRTSANELGKECLVYQGHVFLTYDKPFGYYGRVPLINEHRRDLGDYKFLDYTKEADKDPDFTRVAWESSKGILPTDEQDKEISNKLYDFLYKLLCVLSTRNDSFILEGEQTRKVKYNRKGEIQKEALWSPNFIGKSYKAAHDIPEGTHASPRMHWRRGHIRLQKWGKGLSLTKSIWIEPVLINPEK